MFQKSELNTPPISPSGWLKGLVKLKPAQWDKGHSIRLAIATALPLAIGVITNTMPIFLWIALGGLMCGTGERGATYRYRIKLTWCSSLIGILGFLGGFLGAGSNPIIALIVQSAILMGVFSLIMGLISGFGQIFSIGSMQALLLASICVGIPNFGSFFGISGGADYFLLMGFYLIGTCFYWLLLLVEYGFVRDKPQRIILANMLHALSALAKNANASSDKKEKARKLALDTQAIAYTNLMQGRRNSNGRTRESSNYAAILQSIDTLSTMLIGRQFDSPSLCTASQWLESLAIAVEQNSPMPAVPVNQKNDSLLFLQIHILGNRLWKKPDIVDSPSSSNSHKAIHTDHRRQFSIGKGVYINASRLALCMMLAVAMIHIIPGSHSFWIPLTVALVMKPDFGSIVARAVQRSAGTLLGVIVGAAILFLLPKGLPLVAVIAILSFLLPHAMQQNYLVQAVWMAPLILLFVDLIVPGPKTIDYAGQRALDTIIGGLIVIIFGYLIWPRSIFSQVQHSFSKAVQTVKAYLIAVLSHSLSPMPTSSQSLASLRRSSYQQLSNLRISLQNALEQPPPAGTKALSWFPSIESAERLCDAITAYAELSPKSKTDNKVFLSWISQLDSISAGVIPDKYSSYAGNNALLIQIDQEISYLGRTIEHT